MAKAPAFQFYPGDWRRDTQVQMASMATRGVWMEMLCCMWDAPERGVLSGANDQIARLLGCAKEEFALALKEIETLQIADVLRDCNGIVTIKSRRMQRDEKERKNTKIRVARVRKKAVQKDDVTVEKRKCNANVTVASSSSSSTSLLTTEINNARGDEIPDGFISEIVDVWNKESGCLPVVELSPLHNQRLVNLHRKHPGLDWWQTLFSKIKNKMPHLCGKNDREWTASLGWIIDEKNWANVINGQYVTKEIKNGKRKRKHGTTHADRVNNAIRGNSENSQAPSF